jgi:hypothetical protein
VLFATAFHLRLTAISLMLTLPPPSSPSTGSGESGKSTIVKQMKIIHQNGFSREELLTYRMTVYRNLVDSAQAIVLALRKIAIDCETPSNRVSWPSCLSLFGGERNLVWCAFGYFTHPTLPFRRFLPCYPCLFSLFLLSSSHATPLFLAHLPTRHITLSSLSPSPLHTS